MKIFCLVSSTQTMLFLLHPRKSIKASSSCFILFFLMHSTIFWMASKAPTVSHFFVLSSMRPTHNSKQFVFLGGPRMPGRGRGREYCHQKLITIKISGEKAAKEKIVRQKKHRKKHIERMSNNGNQHEFEEKKIK